MLAWQAQGVDRNEGTDTVKLRIRRETSAIVTRSGLALVALLLALGLTLAACSGPDDERPLSQEDQTQTSQQQPQATSTAPAATVPADTSNTSEPQSTTTVETPAAPETTPEGTATQAADVTPTATPSPPPVAPTVTATTAPATAEPEPTPLPVFDPARVSIEVEQVASGFSEPLYVTHANDGSGRIFIAEKTGAIRLLDGSLFLDLSGRVSQPGVFGRDHELGFLGLAFHPRFAETGWFYVNYSDLNGNNVISRFSVGSGGVGDPGSEMVMLRLEQPDVNFNGGGMLFGADGYLYIGTGTGGEPDYLQHLAQDPTSLFGKILRIDVDHGEPYMIPADNPMVGQQDARPEIYIMGVRNPYRFAFDSATGDLYIGGPGQFQREWIEFVPAGQQNGAVLRWPYLEGSICSTHVDSCNPGEFPAPIVEYQTYSNATCVILGGEVYRGEEYPLLQGAYFFGDFCNAPLRVAWQDANGNWDWQEILRLGEGAYLGSFGRDEAGEVYVTDIANGIIYQIVARER